MERTVTDKFGTALAEGDTVCFTLSMRADQKPIVRAAVRQILPGKARHSGGHSDWLVVDYLESDDVRWGRDEGRLPHKIVPHRVVKCY